MKRTELHLPDAIYHQVERLAEQLNLTVAEFLRKAAEQTAQGQAQHQPNNTREWRFPEGRRLGAFRGPVGDWRLLANEAAD